MMGGPPALFIIIIKSFHNWFGVTSNLFTACVTSTQPSLQLPSNSEFTNFVKSQSLTEPSAAQEAILQMFSS